MQERAAAPPLPQAGRLSYTRLQRRWAPYVFVSPFFILFLVFGLFPTLFSLFLSFQRWKPDDGLFHWEFVGLHNYLLNLTDKDFFWKSVWNTFYIGLLSGVAQHVVAIPLAFVIHRSIRRWQNTVISAYFAPYVTNSVAIALVFSTLLGYHSGLINWVLLKLHLLPGGEPINWLGLPATIGPAIALVIFWRYVGWNTVLYLAGLQAISEDVYEAATVDGASKGQQFWFITLPLLRPMMFYAVTLTIIGNLQIFEEPFMMVGQDGGNGNAGLTTAMYMYNTAFRDLDMGYAASISWLLFVLIVGLTLITNYLFNRQRR